MIDRFTAFESDTICASQKMKQIAAKRATLTRNSMTCLIGPSFGIALPFGRNAILAPHIDNGVITVERWL
jgi:hypothetical protein